MKKALLFLPCAGALIFLAAFKSLAPSAPAGVKDGATMTHAVQNDRPCHPAGDIVPCGHAMHYAGDIIPCGHVCFNNWGNAVPCHPGGDVVPCGHALHAGGDIVPCAHVCY